MTIYRTISIYRYLKVKKTHSFPLVKNVFHTNGQFIEKKGKRKNDCNLYYFITNNILLLGE